jgi:hypothetical protein
LVPTRDDFAVRFSTLLTIILALLTLLVAPAQTPKSNPKPASTVTPYPTTTDPAPPTWFIDVPSQAGVIARNVNGSVDHTLYIIKARHRSRHHRLRPRRLA